MKFLNIYSYIYFNPVKIQIIVTLLYYFAMFLNGEVNYCDDGSTSNYDNSMTVSGNPVSWESSYQSRAEGYQTQYNDGRAIYQPYNKVVQATSPQTQYVDGRPVYQAYNEGLQSTSYGHRYELDGNQASMPVSRESFIVELDGTPVYATYHSTGANGNSIYSYSHDGSTMLGLIEPTKSEILNNGYYHGGPCWVIVDTSPTTLKGRCYNKIKTTISNHIAKSSDEAYRQREAGTERYINNVRRSQNMSRSRDAKKYQDMCKGRPIKVKGRKWD